MSQIGTCIPGLVKRTQNIETGVQGGYRRAGNCYVALGNKIGGIERIEDGLLFPCHTVFPKNTPDMDLGYNRRNKSSSENWVLLGIRVQRVKNTERGLGAATRQQQSS